MNQTELISVIVPVYNTAPYIETCIRSIQQQSYERIEIITVDDGSTDGSGKILDQLAEEYSNMIVVHQSNGGVTNARITGLKKAAGNWIGFVDGDDEIESGMYEHLLNNAHKYCADISHCGYQMLFPNRVDYYYNTGRLLVQNKQIGLKDLIEGEFIEPGLCNKLYHISLFYKLINDNLIDTSIKNTEDLLMNFYLFREANVSIYEDFCPYHYNIREGSASTSRINENKLKDPLCVLKIIKSLTIEDASLQKCVNSRIIGQLIRLATIEDDNQVELIRPYKNRARKELLDMLPELLHDSYSKRTKMLAVLAAISPSTYALLHKSYSRMRGTDRKFKV